MSLLSPSLEAFWAVVQTGTVLEAAKIVNLTQTGVTQRIRSLEKQLGVTLFTRSRKGMRLTNEGEAILKYVESARILEGNTLAHLAGKENSALVNICISGTSALLRSRLIPQTSSIVKKYPYLRLRFDFADNGSPLEKLKSGFAHLAVLQAHQVGLELDSKVLSPERYILVGPSKWKKRSLTDILEKENIIDFDPDDTMTFNLLKKYKLQKKARRERHFANNIDGLTSMIANGMGYSSLSIEYASEFIRAGSLVQLDKNIFLDEAVALAWYPRAEMPNYLQDLIQSFSVKK